jgi:glycosyltransferase 2 family protein
VRREGLSVGARIAIGAAVSVGLLALLLAHADPSEVLAGLKRASLPGVAAVLVAHLVSLLLRVHRWQLLLRASGCAPPPGVHRWLVFDSVFFGWLCNLVLPARVGEVARPGMFARGSGLPLSRVLATSVVERAADLGVVALGCWFALVVLPAPDAVPSELRTGARVAGLAALVGVVVLAALARRGAGEPSSAPPGRLAALFARFREGLGALRDPSASARVFGWTVLIWAVEALCVQLALLAFGFEPSWSLAICHVVAVTLSIAVVTVPAGLGVEQGVTVVLLAAWNIGKADALALSLVLTFAAIFWVVPFGLAAMARQGGRLPS